jgi:hypothetical protein
MGGMTIIRRWWRFAAVMVGVSVAAFTAGRALTLALRADVGSFDAGLVATVAGIVVGVPIAIRISLEQQSQSRLEQERADEERRQALLRLIGDDLLQTLQELEGRSPDRLEYSITPFLGSGLYRTLRASGDLSLIRDARLLRAISRAYDRIDVTAYLERLSWETSMNPEARRRTHPLQTVIQEAREHVAGQDEHTHAAIDVALEVMGRSRGE